jgi:hypothetical protein
MRNDGTDRFSCLQVGFHQAKTDVSLRDLKILIDVNLEKPKAWTETGLEPRETEITPELEELKATESEENQEAGRSCSGELGSP